LLSGLSNKEKEEERMSLRRIVWALAVVLCLVAPAAVQAQGEYLDILIAKVKPEKLPDFQTETKTWADANRRFDGDHWITFETVYGEGNVYQFTSTRKDYADIDKAGEAEMLAANKAFGEKGAEKAEQDFMNCLVSYRAEFRRRRWDLSRKPPADAEAYAKLIGESRYLRTTAVHVRTGHIVDFEALLKDMKEAGEKNPVTQPVFVSQVMEGGKGTIFYLSTLRSSLAGFDHNPSMLEILGEEGYKKYLQVAADTVETTESTLYRVNPELSNPPEDVAKVAPDFWHPKAMMAPMAKPKAPAKAPAKKS
jgi:hypothetical protein